MNLGEQEYLVGASPEMFVRVTGRRVETCPISGTISRGADAIEDSEQILKLLKSKKDESELTMCSDVDRNDKSRVCEPGSVRVIGRRQIEMYSRLIHTVDHIEGQLRSEMDAFDAFLSHAWAVTVTGAPKLWAMRFIENNEKSTRYWFGSDRSPGDLHGGPYAELRLGFLESQADGFRVASKAAGRARRGAVGLDEDERDPPAVGGSHCQRRSGATQAHHQRRAAFAHHPPRGDVPSGVVGDITQHFQWCAGRAVRRDRSVPVAGRLDPVTLGRVATAQEGDLGFGAGFQQFLRDCQAGVQGAKGAAAGKHNVRGGQHDGGRLQDVTVRGVYRLSRRGGEPPRRSASKLHREALLARMTQIPLTKSSKLQPRGGRPRKTPQSCDSQR